jgi:transcriptional regulator with XRE-family HTH domain
VTGGKRLSSEDSTTEFSKWVMNQIEKTGLSMLEIEKESGMSYYTMYQWRKGRNGPTFDGLIVFSAFIALKTNQKLKNVFFSAIETMPSYQSCQIIMNRSGGGAK